MNIRSILKNINAAAPDDSFQQMRTGSLTQLATGFSNLSKQRTRRIMLRKLAIRFNMLVERARSAGHARLDVVLDALVVKSVVQAAPAPLAPKESFALWRTFSIGGMDKKELISKTKAVGVLKVQAENLIKRQGFKIQPHLEQIDTVALTPLDLRLSGEEEMPTTTAELFNPERLAQWNEENKKRLPYGRVIGLLPVETGLHVRIQYRDQPSGETLIIATEPVVDSDPHRGIIPYRFCVKRSRNGEKQSLEACRALLDTSWWPRIVQAHIAPPRILYRLREVVPKT